MTACGICGGTLRSTEKTYTARSDTGTETANVCASCINTYRLGHRT